MPTALQRNNFADGKLQFAESVPSITIERCRFVSVAECARSWRQSAKNGVVFAEFNYGCHLNVWWLSFPHQAGVGGGTSWIRVLADMRYGC
jgi:hypothetical protein